jgi:hypothetical protein
LQDVDIIAIRELRAAALARESQLYQFVQQFIKRQAGLLPKVKRERSGDGVHFVYIKNVMQGVP